MPNYHKRLRSLLNGSGQFDAVESYGIEWGDNGARYCSRFVRSDPLTGDVCPDVARYSGSTDSDYLEIMSKYASRANTPWHDGGLVRALEGEIRRSYFYSDDPLVPQRFAVATDEAEALNSLDCILQNARPQSVDVPRRVVDALREKGLVYRTSHEV